jgi:hypothetical protein
MSTVFEPLLEDPALLLVVLLLLLLLPQAASTSTAPASMLPVIALPSKRMLLLCVCRYRTTLSPAWSAD